MSVKTGPIRGDRKSRGRFLRYRKELHKLGVLITIEELQHDHWVLTFKTKVMVKTLSLTSRWRCNHEIENAYKIIVRDSAQLKLFYGA